MFKRLTKSESIFSKLFLPDLVSVIIPTFNRANLLLETLSSVFLQTHRPIEVVVIDDGSTDDTKEQIFIWKREYNQEPEFKVNYIRQDNRGAPAARNNGVIASKGEYIQYLDSDDTLDPRKIELQVQFLRQNPSCDVALGHSFDMDTLKQAEPLVLLTRDTGLLKCITSWTIPTNNPLFRRTACVQLGLWDERMKCYEDTSYMAGIFCKGLNVRCVQGADSFIRGHHRIACDNQGPRVSYRGEVERVYDNVLALYWHHEYIWREFPVEYKENEIYLNAILKECFRVARLLLQIGETERAKSLLKRLSDNGHTLRQLIDRLTLDGVCMFLGDRLGATFHEQLYNCVNGFKTKYIGRSVSQEPLSCGFNER